MAYTKTRPTIGITMGDASGIGPEIVVKALQDVELREAIRAVIVGDASHLRSLAERCQLALSDFGQQVDGAVEIVDLGNLTDNFPIGVDNAVSGRASAEYIEKAVELWRVGQIDAIATAPISKRAINLAGYDYPGHTEFLAHLTNTSEFAMSFFADKLRVVLLSTHLPLIDAIEFISKERLEDLIVFFERELSKLIGRRPKLAVAGLNPHASEGGMFGIEEQIKIAPAVQFCIDKFGTEVSGPYSPDTIFLRCFRGEFDGVVALYHDQATIPVKSLSFGSAVNVTLGLPLVRTSVDHGTAFDIAGTWSADESSMQAAIRLAGELVSNSPNRI